MMPLWAIPLVFAQAIFLYGGEEELGLARRDAAGAGKEHARLRLRRC